MPTSPPTTASPTTPDTDLVRGAVSDRGPTPSSPPGLPWGPNHAWVSTVPCALPAPSTLFPMPQQHHLRHPHQLISRAHSDIHIHPLMCPPPGMEDDGTVDATAVPAIPAAIPLQEFAVKTEDEEDRSASSRRKELSRRLRLRIAALARGDAKPVWKRPHDKSARRDEHSPSPPEPKLKSRSTSATPTPHTYARPPSAVAAAASGRPAASRTVTTRTVPSEQRSSAAAASTLEAVAAADEYRRRMAAAVEYKRGVPGAA
ncbi:hypothetical protein BDK51DRAFT_29901, partial [Blyttiomyces helicus]